MRNVRNSIRTRFTLSGAIAVLAATSGVAQPSYPPANTELPNPYRTILSWAQLPDGRKFGATAGAAIGPDGNIWTYERCGSNTCAGLDAVDPILELDQKTGKVLRQFGKGLFVEPHGFFVDKDGNVWVTDDLAAKDGSKGLQVFKFSPDGKILLTLGKKGVAGQGPDAFGAPSNVAVAPNGDIFVADGHNGCNCPNSRIVKFDKNGNFIKEFGKKGSAPGDLDNPHSLAFDSAGRLFVADRSNNRVEIFDQEGKFIAEWKQFSRPSGLFIKDDILYVSDSESRTKEGSYGYNPEGKRGIRMGSVKDGKVTAFIPDPDDPTGGSEGVAVDHEGNVYGASRIAVDAGRLEKFVPIRKP
jgi:sugar lactone lactonase YvrE